MNFLRQVMRPDAPLPAAVNSQIANEQYHSFPGTNTTICLLKMRNGCTVIGVANCVYDADFDIDIGQASAREDAVRKVFELEAYMLHEKLAQRGEVQQGLPVTKEPGELEA